MFILTIAFFHYKTVSVSIYISKASCSYFFLYRVYQKKVDKSETALYFVKRFNVRTFLLK